MESENGNCGGDVGDITVSSLRYRRAARVVSIVELILNTILVVVVVVSVVILVSAFIYLESEGYVEEEAQNGEEEEQLGPQYIIGLAIELFILAVYVFLPFIASVALFRSTNKKSDRPMRSRLNHAFFWLISTVVFIVLNVIASSLGILYKATLIAVLVRLIFLYFVAKYTIELNQIVKQQLEGYASPTAMTLPGPPAAVIYKGHNNL